MNPLQGKTIVVTRSLEQSEEFRKLLKMEGAECIVFPTIEIKPPMSWTDCDAAISRLSSFDAIVFSSSNAVKFFFERINRDHLLLMKQNKVYVVGEKTYSMALKYGIVPVIPPEINDGEHLAKMIVDDGIRNKKVLIPKGNLGRGTIAIILSKAGAHVEEVIVYRTIIPEIQETEKLKNLLQQKKIDAITFFSPSSLRNFIALFQRDLLSHVVIAVIGNVTAEEAHVSGLKVDVVSTSSTSEGMIEALKNYFTTNIN